MSRKVGLGVSLTSPLFTPGSQVDVHVPEVKEANVPQVNRFSVKHFLWAHRQRDTTHQLCFSLPEKSTETYWSHSFHSSCHSSHFGTFFFSATFVSLVINGDRENRTGGLSRTQSLYSELGAFQLLTTRKSAWSNSSRASRCEYYMSGECIGMKGGKKSIGIGARRRGEQTR